MEVNQGYLEFLGVSNDVANRLWFRFYVFSAKKEIMQSMVTYDCKSVDSHSASLKRSFSDINLLAKRPTSAPFNGFPPFNTRLTQSIFL